MGTLRVGRSGHEGLLDDWHARGVAFVTLGEGIDTSTPAGGSSLACSARSRSSSAPAFRNAFTPGWVRASAQGTKLGRRAVRLTKTNLAAVASLSVRGAARELGVSVNTYQKARKLCQQTSEADVDNLGQDVVD